MHNFTYDIKTKVYFGRDNLGTLGAELKALGSRVLICYGGGSIKKTGLYERVIKQIQDSGLTAYELSGIAPNPRIEDIRRGVEICKNNSIDVVLAVGGGSVLDSAKFVCAGACADFDPWEFFSEKAPIARALPLITVLTISATGSEMNPTGVVSNLSTQDKLGRSDPKLRPMVSYLDPENTFTVSPYQTACGSADILSHIFEVYFQKEPTLYMVDCFMEGLMKTVIKYAPIAMKEPDNYEARANLMWASSWAINGFISGPAGGAWSCHPIEHELSATYDITHGLGLAIITPRWLRYCLSEETLPKYRQFGVNVFGINSILPDRKIAEKAIKELEQFLFVTLGLTDKLSELGVKKEEFPRMAEKACGGGVIPGFRALGQKDIETIYEMSW